MIAAAREVLRVSVSRHVMLGELLRLRAVSCLLFLFACLPPRRLFSSSWSPFSPAAKAALSSLLQRSKSALSSSSSDCFRTAAALVTPTYICPFLPAACSAPSAAVTLSLTAPASAAAPSVTTTHRLPVLHSATHAAAAAARRSLLFFATLSTAALLMHESLTANISPDADVAISRPCSPSVGFAAAAAAILSRSVAGISVPTAAAAAVVSQSTAGILLVTTASVTLSEAISGTPGATAASHPPSPPLCRVCLQIASQLAAPAEAFHKFILLHPGRAAPSFFSSSLCPLSPSLFPSLSARLRFYFLSLQRRCSKTEYTRIFTLRAVATSTTTVARGALILNAAAAGAAAASKSFFSSKTDAHVAARAAAAAHLAVDAAGGGATATSLQQAPLPVFAGASAAPTQPDHPPYFAAAAAARAVAAAQQAHLLLSATAATAAQSEHQLFFAAAAVGAAAAAATHHPLYLLPSAAAAATAQPAHAFSSLHAAAPRRHCAAAVATPAASCRFWKSTLFHTRSRGAAPPHTSTFGSAAISTAVAPPFFKKGEAAGAAARAAVLRSAVVTQVQRAAASSLYKRTPKLEAAFPLHIAAAKVEAGAVSLPTSYCGGAKSRRVAAAAVLHKAPSQAAPIAAAAAAPTAFRCSHYRSTGATALSSLCCCSISIEGASKRRLLGAALVLWSPLADTGPAPATAREQQRERNCASRQPAATGRLAVGVSDSSTHPPFTSGLLVCLRNFPLRSSYIFSLLPGKRALTYAEGKPREKEELTKELVAPLFLCHNTRTWLISFNVTRLTSKAAAKGSIKKRPAGEAGLYTRRDKCSIIRIAFEPSLCNSLSSRLHSLSAPPPYRALRSRGNTGLPSAASPRCCLSLRLPTASSTRSTFTAGGKSVSSCHACFKGHSGESAAAALRRGTFGSSVASHLASLLHIFKGLLKFTGFHILEELRISKDETNKGTGWLLRPLTGSCEGFSLRSLVKCIEKAHFGRRFIQVLLLIRNKCTVPLKVVAPNFASLFEFFRLISSAGEDSKYCWIAAAAAMEAAGECAAAATAFWGTCTASLLLQKHMGISCAARTCKLCGVATVFAASNAAAGAAAFFRSFVRALTNTSGAENATTKLQLSTLSLGENVHNSSNGVVEQLRESTAAGGERGYLFRSVAAQRQYDASPSPSPTGAAAAADTSQPLHAREAALQQQRDPPVNRSLQTKASALGVQQAELVAGDTITPSILHSPTSEVQIDISSLSSFANSLHAWCASSDALHAFIKEGLLGCTVFWMLGGRFFRLSPSSLLAPGAYHQHCLSLRAGVDYASLEERRFIKKLGETFGCHTCGRRRGVEEWVADHQPPKSVVVKFNQTWVGWVYGALRRAFGDTRYLPQRFYPQCKTCSSKQATVVKHSAARMRKADLVIDWKSIRAYHLTGGILQFLRLLACW